MQTTAIKIAGYQFEGPFYHARKFEPNFGCVYVVLNDDNQVIDVGQTGDVNSRILNHERKNCWYQYGVGEMGLYVFVNSDRDFRMRLEGFIRERYSPPCGR